MGTSAGEDRKETRHQTLRGLVVVVKSLSAIFKDLDSKLEDFELNSYVVYVPRLTQMLY